MYHLNIKNLFLVLVLMAGIMVGWQDSYASPRAAVTFVEVSDPNMATLKTLRMLVEEELGQHNIEIVYQPELLLVSRSLQNRMNYARVNNIERIYELKLLPIGESWLVNLAERDVSSEDITYSARLKAKDLEELDIVIIRVVESVITKNSLESNQKIDNLVKKETKAFNKKAGEFLWGFSVMTGSPFADNSDMIYGGALKFSYEMANVRLDYDIGGMGGDSHAHFDTGIRAHYLFSKSNFSPFVGGGLGLLILDPDHASNEIGAALSLNAGVELLRLHSVRLIAEGQLLLPLFAVESHNYNYDMGYDEESEKMWYPIGVFKLSLLW